MPPDWFPPEVWPLLVQLCRHICQARWFGDAMQEMRAGLLDPTDDDQLDRIERIVRCHNRESNAVSMLMVRLRLTSQQRLEDNDETAKKRAAIPDDKPWATSTPPRGARAQ